MTGVIDFEFEGDLFLPIYFNHEIILAWALELDFLAGDALRAFLGEALAFDLEAERFEELFCTGVADLEPDFLGILNLL